jgi:Uncharacterised nucleotidyltransferase
MNNAPRPELRLLIYSVKRCLETREAIQVKSLVSSEIEWIYLVQMAQAHGVMPLLYRTLNSNCSDAVPNAILEQLRDHFYTNAGRNLFLAKELLKLLHLLEAHKIPAIPYKGPVLAASVYGNLLLRQFGDLDILVRERDYERAQHLLTAQEYRLMKEAEWESTFLDRRVRVVVDLHKGLTPREFPSPLNFEYLSGRLQRIILAGTEVPNLSPEDTLLMLAVQITKDAGTPYFQLAKICDIAELLRVYPHLHSAKTLKQAKSLGGERMLLFSLRLTSNLLGTELPQDIICKMPFHPSIDKLADYARQQLFDRDDRTVRNQPAADQFRWLIRERLRDKIYPYYLRYLHDVIINVIIPCELDRRLLPLPGRLSFLYYFIRPVRLAQKYGLLLLRRVYDFGRITIYRHMTKKLLLWARNQNIRATAEASVETEKN